MTNLLPTRTVLSIASALLFSQVCQSAWSAERLGCDIAKRSGELRVAVIAASPSEVINKDETRYRPDPLFTTSFENYKRKLESLFASRDKVSLASYWRSVSEGRVETVVKVFGPVTLSEPIDLRKLKKGAQRGYTDGAGLDEIVGSILKDAAAQVDFSDYDRVFVMLPTLIPGGTFGFGQSSLGCERNSALKRDLSYTILSSFGEKDLDRGSDSLIFSLVHEGGHQLGLSHASALIWDHGAFSDSIDRASRVEYGEKYSAMGSGSGFYAAPHLKMLGWLDPSEITELKQDGQGSFTIRPLSAEGIAGTKALVVQRSKKEKIWLEYRQPIGLVEDAAYRSMKQELWASQLDPMAGVIVHVETRDALPNTLAVAFPSTYPWGYEPLIRSEWKDPSSNLTIRVLKQSRDGIEVQIAR